MAGKVIDVPRGLYNGVIQTDFIDTVSETKLPYLDVLIPQFYDKDKDYPYTWVPSSFFFLSPLKKDTKVVVQFYTNLPMYPVLFSVDGMEVPDVWSEYENPDDGDLVTFPDIGKTFQYQIYDENHYELWTDTAHITHTPNSATYQTDDMTVTYAKTSAGILSDKVNIEGKSEVVFKTKKLIVTADTSTEITTGKFAVDSKSGKISLKNSAMQFKSLLDEFLDAATDTAKYCAQINTIGSPSAQTLNPSLIVNFSQLLATLSALKAKFGQLLE